MSLDFCVNCFSVTSPSAAVNFLSWRGGCSCFGNFHSRFPIQARSSLKLSLGRQQILHCSVNLRLSSFVRFQFPDKITMSLDFSVNCFSVTSPSAAVNFLSWRGGSSCFENFHSRFPIQTRSSLKLSLGR